MRSLESIATSKLKAIGCWTEISNGQTTRVSFEDCVCVTYDDLLQLVSLRHLKRLCFYGTPVDGHVLSLLTCNCSLASLNLNCTHVSWRDINLVAKFPNLQSVGLMATAANDNCLESIISCPEITDLRIDDTEITPGGTKRLAESLELDTLWIGGTQLSSEALGSISQLPKLREFNVCGETVDDSHIELLLTFPLTGRLFIRNTRVSNSGLVRLAGVDPRASNVG